MINAPRFAAQNLSEFLGTVEYTGNDYRVLWDLALDTTAIRAACVGFEEGVELDDSKLTVDSFPWTDWPLVIGGIRNLPNGPWTIHTGPEMKWFDPGKG